MWYFTWILGLGLALTFGILNALWFEMLESGSEDESHSLPLGADGKAEPDS